ncbi:hypothetical protein BDR05DRAFT_949207 [Suillus weaverae]|nr:hypothetical protein BDR05DRAFT_949207 [Suillus weaverae]
MNISSTSDIEISLWCTWTLTVTHEACEYTEQKFNAEKTGGDLVIPSPKLDTDLVMACDQLVNWLIKAYENPRHNEERGEKLLERCPPGHEGIKLVDIPATILDASSAIITWYLLDALTDATQGWFKPSLENDVLTPGCINLSLAWFQQGHENQLDLEVSASLKGASSKKILTAIATMALRVMHPEQY